MNHRYDLDRIEACPQERQIIELILDGKISTALNEARIFFAGVVIATPALLFLTACGFLLAYSALFSQSVELALNVAPMLRILIASVWLIFLLEQLCQYQANSLNWRILCAGSLGAAILFVLAGSVANGSRFTVLCTFILAVATFGIMGTSHAWLVDAHTQDLNDKRLITSFHLATLLPGLIFSLYETSLREHAAWSGFHRIDKQCAVDLLYGAANFSSARLREITAQHGKAYAQRLVAMLEKLNLIYRVRDEIRLTREGEVTLNIRAALV